ncbi:MAG UNVERIFIED_CONTAM: hypothetical protein MIN83_25790 [Paenibacillus polymyxa]|nr:hypothetical protein [Paenibacillus polymyxa]
MKLVSTIATEIHFKYGSSFDGLRSTDFFGATNKTTKAVIDVSNSVPSCPRCIRGILAKRAAENTAQNVRERKWNPPENFLSTTKLKKAKRALITSPNNHPNSTVSINPEYQLSLIPTA